jgi:hypothetical protein
MSERNRAPAIEGWFTLDVERPLRVPVAGGYGL